MMLFLDGSFDNREMYQINGALSEARIEYLLDIEDHQAMIKDSIPLIEDARASFMDEDFLNEDLKHLRTLCKQLRGDNRMELERIVTRMEETVGEALQRAEHGLEQLKKLQEKF